MRRAAPFAITEHSALRHASRSIHTEALSQTLVPNNGTSGSIGDSEALPTDTGLTTPIPFPNELSYGISEPPAILQTTPSLMTALNEVRGTLLLSGGRIGPDGVDSFKVVTLNLATWEEKALTTATTDSAYRRPLPMARDRLPIRYGRDEEFDIYIMKNTAHSSKIDRQLCGGSSRILVARW